MTARPSGELPTNGTKRGVVGKVLGWTLGPLYYWLDLYDATRRPNHGKIVATAVLLVLLGVEVYLARHLFGPEGDADRYHATELWAFIVLAVLLTFASYGLPGLKIWATTKGGGTVDAASTVATGEIARRRDSVAGVEPTP